MKRIISICLMLMLLLTVSAGAESEIAEGWSIPDDAEDTWDEELSGGWEICDLTTAKGGDALRAALAKAVEDMAGVTYTPVALLGTQSVGGMNYCILCHCAYVSTETGETGWSLVYLYQSLDGAAQVTNIVNIDIASLADYGLLK